MSSDEGYNLSEDEGNLLPGESHTDLIEELENVVEPVEFESANNENEQEENENQEGEETKEEDKKETKTKRVHNPQPKLDVERLRGPRGLTMLLKVFEGVKFKGRGHEEGDLCILLKNYEYWCHRMFPKFPFDDCIEKMERLGNKRFLQTYLGRIRQNLEDEVLQSQELVNDDVNDDDLNEQSSFDNLLLTPAAQPVDTGPITLTEEQLRQIEMNREKAQQLRQQMLAKNKVNNENVAATSTDHSSQISEYNINSKQDSVISNGSSNGDFLEGPSQFMTEADVHVSVSELVDKPSQDICNAERNVSFNSNTQLVAEISTCQNETAIEEFEELKELDSCSTLENINISNGSSGMFLREMITNKNLNKERDHSGELNMSIDASTQEASKQNENNELTDDVLADFMNEDLDDLIEKTTRKTNQKLKELQRENISEDNLTMEVDI